MFEKERLTEAVNENDTIVIAGQARLVMASFVKSK